MPDSAIRATDLIIGRGILSAEAIAQELRNRLGSFLERDVRRRSFPDLLETARNILEDFEPLLAQNLLDADLAAWIAGMDRVAKQLPRDVLEEIEAASILPPAPPRLILPELFGDDEPIIRFPKLESAATDLLTRNVVTRAEFDEMTEAMRAQAFTVAQLDSEDAIEAIRDSLAEDIAEGTSLRKFRKRVDERLGSSRIGPAHLETVYRTNVQSAFTSGHETIANNPVVDAVFPYQRYVPIEDARARPEHLALARLGLDGTNVYRRDDPVWDLFTPPWDFSCRCGIVLMSITSAARAGVHEAQIWLATGQPPVNPEWRIDAIPFRPDPDFVGGGRRRVAA